jgi:hypothetical protein
MFNILIGLLYLFITYHQYNSQMSIYLSVQHYTSSIVVKQVALPLDHQKTSLKDYFYTKVYGS